MDIVIKFLTDWSEVLALALFVVMFVNSQAKAAVAATNEIMQKAGNMDNEVALELAATLLGKISFLSWIPIGIRKWICQIIFDGIKKVAVKNQ